METQTAFVNFEVVNITAASLTPSVSSNSSFDASPAPQPIPAKSMSTFAVCGEGNTQGYYTVTYSDCGLPMFSVSIGGTVGEITQVFIKSLLLPNPNIGFIISTDGFITNGPDVTTLDNLYYANIDNVQETAFLIGSSLQFSITYIDLSTMFSGAILTSYSALFASNSFTFDDVSQLIQNMDNIMLLNPVNLSQTINPETWMTQLNNVIGDIPLYQLCMPGAHDSAMGLINGLTYGVADSNTVTQSNGEQLTLTYLLSQGVRYFDIRPTIWTDNMIYGGHFNYIGVQNGPGIWSGAVGDDMSDILNSINTFLRGNPGEVIILDFSHPLNYNNNSTGTYSFSPADTHGLLVSLNGMNNASGFMFFNDTSVTNLNMLTINQVLQSGANVIARFDTTFSDTGNDPQYMLTPANGYWPYSSMGVYNEYANSDDMEDMINDQMGKMVANPPTVDQLFLLSWTLTLQYYSNIPYLQGSIQANANEVNPILYNVLNSSIYNSSSTTPAVTIDSTIYPNILMTDFCCEAQTSALAASIMITMLVSGQWYYVPAIQTATEQVAS